MRHYFINTTHNSADFFCFEEQCLNNFYTFNSCSDIFSKNKIDDGTKTLLETIINQFNLNGKVLDLGCGYGVIGIVLKKHFPTLFVTMVDINKTAIDLAKQNIIKNHLNENDFEIIESNLLENVTGNFDHIVTNPPIKVGKQILFEAMNQCYTHLKEGGTLTLVIRKDHGQESLQKHLKQLFSYCEILKRNKGYYILHCVKHKK